MRKGFVSPPILASLAHTQVGVLAQDGCKQVTKVKKVERVRIGANQNETSAQGVYREERIWTALAC